VFVHSGVFRGGRKQEFQQRASVEDYQFVSLSVLSLLNTVLLAHAQNLILPCEIAE
jgi:hypothetical protein